MCLSAGQQELGFAVVMVYLSVSVSVRSWRQVIFSLKYVVKMRETELTEHFTVAVVAFHIHWFRRKYIYFRVH